MLPIKVIFTFLMTIICTTSGCVSEDEPQGHSLSIGEPLPQFSVTMNNGLEISTSSLEGKIPVIVFFNTDCSDCRKELPVIQQLWEKFKEDNEVEIIPISREESEKDIKEYWSENGLTMPWSAQETRDVYSLFAPSVIPRIYIANKAGVITSTYDDSNMPALSDLVEAIQEALNQ